MVWNQSLIQVSNNILVFNTIVGAWERIGTMRRTSHTGYHEIMGVPSDSENAETSLSNTVDNAATNAREPQSRAQRTLHFVRTKWKQRKSREEIRSTLPTFRPWFTIAVALVNVGLFVAVCISNGIVAIRFTPKQEQGFVEDLDGKQSLETREEPANFFIGPSATDLVHHGAKYSTVSRQ